MTYDNRGGPRGGGAGQGGGQRPGGAGYADRGRPPGDQFPAPSEEDLRAIVQDGDPQKLVDVAERLGRALARSLTTSQIRAFFGAVRQVEMGWAPDGDAEVTRRGHRQLLLLRPKLAYQAARSGGGMTSLQQVLDPAITLVGDDRARFQNFLDFFEAILAYHRAGGGR